MGSRLRSRLSSVDCRRIQPLCKSSVPRMPRCRAFSSAHSLPVDVLVPSGATCGSRGLRSALAWCDLERWPPRSAHPHASVNHSSALFTNNGQALIWADCLPGAVHHPDVVQPGRLSQVGAAESPGSAHRQPSRTDRTVSRSGERGHLECLGKSRPVPGDHVRSTAGPTVSLAPVRVEQRRRGAPGRPGRPRGRRVWWR